MEKTMKSFYSEKVKNEVILLSRFLLVLLFLIFGWNKFTDYSGTIAYMQHVGTPFPTLATIVAIFMELFVSLAIFFGIFTRPLAIFMAIYTLGTAFIGHHYWTMTGVPRFEGEINFYKNISIIGGFFLLYVTGAGKYSLDTKLGLAAE
jgi:putative oxidoreductase